MSEKIRKIINLLNPKSPIAGVEISDFYIRFIYLKNANLMNLDVRLTPGVIKDGRVIQKDKLKDALSKLMEKLGKNAKKLPHIILTTPSSSIFLQTFNLPYLPPDKVPEAARLNMQLISPIPIEEAYSGWDILGDDVRTNQITFLSVFSEKKNIDIIVSACREVGFVVVAIEPSIFSLERAVRQSSPELNPENFHILLNVTNEGMDFAGIMNKKVRFDYFVSWLSMYEGATEISSKIFEDTVARYTQQVLNFSMSNTGTVPKELLLVASEFHDEVKSIIEKNFNIKVIPIDTFEHGKLYLSWGVPYGAYLRGLIPRGEDSLISLASVGTNEEFKRSQLIQYIKLWRNIISVFGTTMIVIFTVSLVFMQSQLKRIKTVPVQELPADKVSELLSLKNQATEFNASVDRLLLVRSGKIPVFPFIDEVQKKVTSDISLTQIDFQSISSPMVVSGIGQNDASIKKFKLSLENSNLFEKVDLPLNSTAPTSGGRYTFSLNITLRK